MARAREHFQDGTRDLQAPLDRLVGVGVGAKGDRLADIALAGQLLLQQSGRTFLVKEPGLEVEARRKPHVCMAGAGIAVIATMATAPVRIDRLVKGNVRRVVGRDDLARLLRLDRGGDALGLILEVPTVIDRGELLPVEAPGRVGEGPSALEVLSADKRAPHAGTVYLYSTEIKCNFGPEGRNRLISRAAGRTDSGRRCPRSP